MNLRSYRLPAGLAQHIESDIFPEYALNDKGHQLPHVEYVIRRSVLFAGQVPDADIAMAVTVAAYHDIKAHVDRARHEVLSAQFLAADKALLRFFTPDQIRIMAEAVEDHRGSSDREPRSIYGRIVASADRATDMDDFIRRMYLYRLKTMPGAALPDIEADARDHIYGKYGSNGYARKKIYFADPEFDAFCRTAETLCNDPGKFHERFVRVNNLLKDQ